MSKRRQKNLLAHFGFTKKSKTNYSEEQQEAGSSADDAFLRATDTTAAATHSVRLLKLPIDL